MGLAPEVIIMLNYMWPVTDPFALEVFYYMDHLNNDLLCASQNHHLQQLETQCSSAQLVFVWLPYPA